MKACAVMQPYLFPYIGYYQLVYASDVFIVYDDVSFIKRSYINRNSIIVNNEVRRFCLPVFGGSSNILIKDLTFGSAKDLLKTIQRSYSRAPYFHDVFRLLSSLALAISLSTIAALPFCAANIIGVDLFFSSTAVISTPSSKRNST